MYRAAIPSCLFLLWLPALSTADVVPSSGIVGGNCSNTLVHLSESYYGVNSIQGIAEKLLGNVQGDCASGKCPQVDVANNCKAQSIDNIQCDMPNIFSTNIKLGTDSICEHGCNDWPCKASCKGVDVAICKGSDWLLCKAGCLGIGKCVRKCQHAIVDPCKNALIKKCSDKCEVAFNSCEAACKKKLTMHISGDFERLQRVISSMKVSTLNVDCTGNGITSPLSFQAQAAIRITGPALSIKVHLSDAGIATTSNVDLQNITLTVAVPISGSADCGPHPFSHKEGYVSVQVGQPSVTDFNLDVDLNLDKTLDSIASMACGGLSFCKDAIKIEISKTIKEEVMKKVPPQVASMLQPVLQKLTSDLHCPKIGQTSKAKGDATLLVV